MRYQGSKHIKKSSAGFTLIEVLVALFIVCLIASTLLPAYLFSNESISRGRHMEQATQLAAGQLDKIRQTGFDELPDIADGESSVSMPISDFGSLPGAKGTVTFTQVDKDLNPATTETSRVLVEATVTWSGSNRDQGKAHLTTLVTAE